MIRRAWNSTLPAGRPIRRKKWMRRGSPRRIGRETPAEREHKRLIRGMRCCAFSKYDGVGRCRGVLQVMHLGHSGGTSRKAGDWTTSTFGCRSHHDQWDGRQKPSVFDAMPSEEREALREREIYLAREFVAGRQAVAA